jgi:hypothetical protein
MEKSRWKLVIKRLDFKYIFRQLKDVKSVIKSIIRTDTGLQLQKSMVKGYSV